uniref:ParB-like N-terminal domain-containing protein n=1 Tax=Klebsiella pneumoniae TaxID=573 RepID=A0A2P1BNR7_KLEPN|nr:hypothetical protein [Klebsiella pneumoniae]
MTESKAKTSVKTSKKNVKPAEAAALKEALEAAQIELVPLSALIKSPLNVRTIPYPVESVRELAESIETIGLIQNLVVHTLRKVCQGWLQVVGVLQPCSYYSLKTASMPGIR